MTVQDQAFRDRLRQLLPQSALYAALRQEPFFSVVADVAERLLNAEEFQAFRAALPARTSGVEPMLTPAREAEIRQRAAAGMRLDPKNDAVGQDYTVLLAEIDRVRTDAGAHCTKWTEYERDYILPAFRWAKELGLDLHARVLSQAGKNCVELLVAWLRDRVTHAEAAMQWVIRDIRYAAPELHADKSDTWDKRLSAALVSAPEEPAGAPGTPADGMRCEQHPVRWWPHDDCAGPGIPLMMESADLRARLTHAERVQSRAHAAIAEALRHLEAVLANNTLVSTMRTNAMSAKHALLRPADAQAPVVDATYLLRQLGEAGLAAVTDAQPDLKRALTAYLRWREGQPLRPKIITLCGSTRFIGDFQDQYARLTDEGAIVLTVGRVVPQSEQRLGSARKQGLDELHLRKIDLSDAILVLNGCGYAGPSTRNEIRYARAHGKGVTWQFPGRIPKEFGGTVPDDVTPPEWHDHPLDGMEQSWCQDPKCPDRGRS